jgi:hypothetical protein
VTLSPAHGHRGAVILLLVLVLRDAAILFLAFQAVRMKHAPLVYPLHMCVAESSWRPDSVRCHGRPHAEYAAAVVAAFKPSCLSAELGWGCSLHRTAYTHSPAWLSSALCTVELPDSKACHHMVW